jgi:hypothetical protein
MNRQILTELELPDATERDRVEAWRLKTLIEAGYTLELAEQLAPRPEIDLHGAVELVANGCEPQLAVRILA